MKTTDICYCVMIIALIITAVLVVRNYQRTSYELPDGTICKTKTVTHFRGDELYMKCNNNRAYVAPQNVTKIIGDTK